MSKNNAQTKCLRCGEIAEELSEYCWKCERELDAAGLELENLRDVKFYIAAYIIGVLALFALPFISMTVDLVKFETYVGFEDFRGHLFLIGYAAFATMFARSFVLNFLGKAKDGSVTGKSGNELVNWYSLKTDYVKLIFSGISIISFAIALWFSVGKFGMYGFAAISLAFMLVGLGIFVKNLINYLKEK